MKDKLKIPIILLMGGVILLFTGWNWRESQWVMKINNQKVSKAEYSFYQKTNSRLSKTALQKKIVEEKVQLQQAEKYGIDTILDYKTMQHEMKKINQENEQKIQANQVVYGLKKYDEASFYRYTLSITITELEKNSAKNISDKKLRSYYKKHQSEFKAIDEKELYRVSGEKKVLEHLNEEGLTQEQVAAYSDVTLASVRLNESTLRDWMKYREDELSGVNDLMEGEWSDLFENMNQSWRYYCLSNQAGEVQSFDTVKEKIVLRLEKEEYQATVKHWVKQAEVEVK